MTFTDKLRELIGRATAGPWKWDGAEHYGYGWVRAPDGVYDTTHSLLTVLRGQYSHMVHDAALICELRNNAEALLAVVEAAERALNHAKFKEHADRDVSVYGGIITSIHIELEAALATLKETT